MSWQKESMWKFGYQLRLNLCGTPQLMKWQRNIWQLTWHSYQERTKHFHCRWRRYILWLKYFHQCMEMELTNSENGTKLSSIKCGHRNASNSCSHRCIRSNQVISNLCTATLYPQQKNSVREKISFFSIIFDYVSRELKHHIYIYSILLFSFHPDGDVLLDEVAFSRLD